jgi:hypothetical protein
MEKKKAPLSGGFLKKICIFFVVSENSCNFVMRELVSASQNFQRALW